MARAVPPRNKKQAITVFTNGSRDNVRDTSSSWIFFLSLPFLSLPPEKHVSLTKIKSSLFSSYINGGSYYFDCTLFVLNSIFYFFSISSINILFYLAFIPNFILHLIVIF